MSIYTTTVATMTIRELISALKTETDRASINQLVYQIDTQVTSEKVRIAALLNRSTQGLERAYNKIKLIDSASTNSRVLTKSANVADTLASHAYYYTQVALATAWREYLRAIEREVDIFQTTLLSSEKARAKMALVAIAKRPPEVIFTAASPLGISSRFRKVEAELQKLRARYGLKNLSVHETPRDLVRTINRASEALRPVWTASISRSFTPSKKGGDVKTVISLT